MSGEPTDTAGGPSAVAALHGDAPLAVVAAAPELDLGAGPVEVVAAVDLPKRKLEHGPAIDTRIAEDAQVVDIDADPALGGIDVVLVARKRGLVHAVEGGEIAGVITQVAFRVYGFPARLPALELRHDGR